MNKKILFLPMGLLLGTFISCSWQIPEKVSVSTKAKYNFSLGQVSPGSSLGTVGEMLGKNMQSASGSYSLYDYQPEGSDDDTQQFAIEMPILNYDLDFGQYLQNMDFTSKLTGMSITPDPIGIPDFNLPSTTEKVNLESVNTSINEMVVIYAKSGIDSNIKMSMNEGNDFDKITYESGKLNISIYSVLDIGDLNSADLNNISASIVKKSGTVSVNGVEAEITNGSGTLDLTDFVISKEGMTVSDSLGVGYVIIGRVDSSSKVKKVEGLTMAEPMKPSIAATNVYSKDTSSSLKSCVIDEGYIKLGTEVPGTWTNVGIESSFTFSNGLKDQSGSNLYLSNNEKKDLKGASYLNEDINVVPEFTLTFNDSTIVFADEPEMKIDFSITKIASATIALNSSQKASDSSNTALDSSVTKLLKRIVWNEAGVKVTYVNSLPAGNDIGIMLNCGFLGLNNLEKSITSNQTEEKTENWTSTDYTTVIGTGTGEFSSIDLSFNYTLPGWNEEEKTITVQNVEIGKDYNIKIAVEPVIDWSSIFIDNSQAGIKNSMGISFSLKDTLSQLGDSDLMKKIGFDTIPVYLFSDFGNMGSVLNNPGFAGSINAYPAVSSTDADGKTVYTLAAGASITQLLPSGKLTNCAVPEMVTTTTEETDTTESSTESTALTIANVNLATYAADHNIEAIDLVSLIDTLMNAEEGSGDTIGFDYDLKLCTDSSGSEIEVSKESLDKIKTEGGSTTINLSTVMVLPLKLRIKENITVDNLLPLAGISYVDNPDYDLLQRSSVSDYENIANYAAAIDEAYIQCKNIESPLTFTADEDGKYMELSIDLDGPDKDANKEIEIKLNETKIPISPSDVLNTYPLQPVVKAVLPEGVLGISRTLTIGANISLGLSGSGKPITVWEKQEVEEDE